MALASYPLGVQGTVGECLSSDVVEAIPPDGVLIWLIEYRPLRGPVWADLRRKDFPPRPDHFDLPSLGPRDRAWCHEGPGIRDWFTDADRPLEVSVLFGGSPRPERIREVEAILDSLRFEPLPPPPLDPYAGWPDLTTNSGDSVRTPPGWPAAAAVFPLETPRPRALFFASNRLLPGLPSEFVPKVERLPGPFPEEALTAFPGDGVLVWVLEEDPGPAAPEFQPIGRAWPEGSLAETDRDGLDWLRAGGSFRGYRFSVWLAVGPEASGSDRSLALKSIAALALSGCWRDRFDDCPEGG